MPAERSRSRTTDISFYGKLHFRCVQILSVCLAVTDSPTPTVPDSILPIAAIPTVITPPLRRLLAPESSRRFATDIINRMNIPDL